MRMHTRVLHVEVGWGPAGAVIIYKFTFAIAIDACIIWGMAPKTCMCTCVYTCAHAYAYIYAYACAHVYTHVHMHVLGAMPHIMHASIAIAKVNL